MLHSKVKTYEGLKQEQKFGVARPAKRQKNEIAKRANQLVNLST